MQANIDAVCSLAGGPIHHPVRCTKATKAALESLGLSVFFTKEKEKQRAIKQFYATISSGYLVVAI